jgi:UDPglucose 6-dehydrogenase
MRDSPAISIIQTLQDGGATIVGYDPEGMQNAAKVIDDIAYADDAYSAAAGADAVVIVTEWNQFRALDFARLKSVMKAPLLVDLRNIYRREEVVRHGFEYTSIGRPDETGETVKRA